MLSQRCHTGSNEEDYSQGSSWYFSSYDERQFKSHSYGYAVSVNNFQDLEEYGDDTVNQN